MISDDMNIRYQDLKFTKEKIVKKFTENPNASVSAAFRNFRKKSYLSFIGDYSLLATITNTIYSLGIKLTRNQVRYALNQSEELKSYSKQYKNTLLNQLINPPYVQIKPMINVSQTTRMQKMSNSSF
jgi:hypothetical protein